MDDDDRDEETPLLPSRGLQTAHAILSLEAPSTPLVTQSEPSSTWEAIAKARTHATEQEVYNTQVLRLWDEFKKDYCSETDLHDALFTELPQAGTGKQRALADLPVLHSPSDALFHAAMLATWYNGRPNAPGAVPPRVSHALDLASYVAGYALVISYVLAPPDRAVIYSLAFGAREVFLILFNIRWRSPSPLVLLAFVLGVGIPRPQSIGFGILLLSFGIYTFQLHTTAPPSPLLLFPEAMMPAAWRLRVAFNRLSPLAMFFPVLVLALVLMSVSLQDTFLQSMDIKTSVSAIPAPLQTRTAFLFIAFFAVIIIIVAFFLLASPSHSPDEDGWRAHFYRVTNYYSSPYFFPPPLSILSLLPLSYRKWAWRVLVAPFAYPMLALVRYVPWRVVTTVAGTLPLLFILLVIVVQ